MDTPLSLWSSVKASLPLRMVLSPPLRGLDTLGLLTRADLDPIRDAPSQQALQACFEGLRKATFLLNRDARHLRRLKYGKALLCMFVKKPSVVLKSILRSSTMAKASTTHPTDLSILRGETTGS